MVYLLHFSIPYWHAQHYIGYTQDLRGRIQYHLRGEGSRLLRAVAQSGRTVVLARRWKDGTRELERRLKSRANASRLCPVCSGRKSHKRGKHAG